MIDPFLFKLLFSVVIEIWDHFLAGSDHFSIGRWDLLDHCMARYI